MTFKTLLRTILYQVFCLSQVLDILFLSLSRSSTFFSLRLIVVLARASLSRVETTLIDFLFSNQTLYLHSVNFPASLFVIRLK